MLLLYFASEFQKAHSGMQEYMQTSKGDEQDMLKIAFARLSYLLYEAEGWPQEPTG